MNKIHSERPSFIYKQVLSHRDKNVSKEYKNYVKKIPMLIKTNGLAATLAFLKVKEDKSKEYEFIYNSLKKWLEKVFNNDKEYENLIENVMNMESNEYRIFTKETLSLFKWWRRFAESEIGE